MHKRKQVKIQISNINTQHTKYKHNPTKTNKKQTHIQKDRYVTDILTNTSSITHKKTTYTHTYKKLINQNKK